VSRLLVGALVVFGGVALFHLAAHDTLGNAKLAWQRLQKPTGGVGATF